jgi:hypothetical protein
MRARLEVKRVDANRGNRARRDQQAERINRMPAQRAHDQKTQVAKVDLNYTRIERLGDAG